jgi:protein-L-isoaspartate(D-aspartate) O-methyltransferase
LRNKRAFALVPWPQVMVENVDGAHRHFVPADVIVASAGATHPLPAWLDALKPSGRLVFPMTPTRGLGGMLLIISVGGGRFSARFLCGAAFYEFAGARDAYVSDRLAEAMGRDRGAATPRRSSTRANLLAPRGRLVPVMS